MPPRNAVAAGMDGCADRLCHVADGDSMRQALEPGRARGATGTVLVTRDRGYLLRADRDHLDATLFQDGFTAGRAALEAGRCAVAAETLRQALELWRGPALADLADYAFTRPEAARLEELRLAAMEARTGEPGWSAAV
jgi:Bacterial transcriptional activator domain